MNNISRQTIKRLPIYLNYLEEKQKEGVENISTVSIAKALGYTEILVKKDISPLISESGKPSIGHKITNLINDIKQYLGYDKYTTAVLVGTGHLGIALLNFDGLKKSNIKIVVSFDKNVDLIGKKINGINIMNIDNMEKICKEMNIHVGIITVNEASAQEVCDRLIASGVKAIWNFAPVVLKVSEDIIIENVNLASSLAILTQKLNNK